MNDNRKLNKKDWKNFIPTNEEELKYYTAINRVKKIKGFYIHVIVFIVINVANFISKAQQLQVHETLFQFKYFSTFLVWGVILVAHGLSVFLPNIILGQNWEEQKIKELIDKEKQNQQKWQ
ncbi:2TM domain-containing protein [Flavobacterium croceum]|uniref:2TM domain-containing protein n=1 Tax=Flavobacterium croceum DSM 17960 TaxID=1121886 RepID=A0A2S4NAY4_9FLAO|nr:2TM domain-containing protein [Flavobacterium croceum]POS02845.1 2TM domain-containing protein [Flavobacterium croceum DSM 17960]